MIFGWASCDFDCDDDGIYNLREKEFLQKCIDKKKEEDAMTVKINWDKTPAVRDLYYSDIPYNSSFMVNTDASKGAVYRKVRIKRDVFGYNTVGDIDAQMEEATGSLFKPTTSPIKRVDVTVNIAATKPSIYN